MSDEHGMPVPSDESPLPWRVNFSGVQAGNGEYIIEVGWINDDESRFTVHAANNIIPCREIVRRLAEPDNLSLGEMEAVIRDATILWSKMLKGAADES